MAFKIHMVKRTRHNRTATSGRANRMSIINGFDIGEQLRFDYAREVVIWPT